MNLGGRHLTYCSNIHPGESWEAVDQALRQALPKVRAQLGVEGPFAVGLRLSAAAALTLEQPAQLERFRAFLTEGGYYVPTINGFPYGAFHGQRVKADVYLPDWRDPARVEYTTRLARLLAALLADHPGMAGSVSTVPGAFRAVLAGEPDVETIARNMLRHAAALVALRDRTGVTIALAIEPEPACLLETVDEVAAFFARYLCEPARVRQVSAETGISFDVADVRRHVGVCLDACHMAVEFEEPEAALRRLREASIRIFKVQVSAAIRLDGCGPGTIERVLRPFAEDTYLHQVVERRAGVLHRYADLPDALATLGRDAGGAGGEDDAPRDWRVHFHVPICLGEMRGLRTTQDDLAALLDRVVREAACDCFEVETYTWDVLPPEYRTVDVCTGIARELAWARAQLQP